MLIYRLISNYKFKTIPKKIPAVFLVANIYHFHNLNLLPGESNIFYQGTYMGQSYVNPSVLTDTLEISIRRDDDILIKRTRIKKTNDKKFLNNSIKVNISWEIEVKNNNKDTVELTIEDQYPVSENKSVEVELLESTEAENDAKKGTLTWKIRLSPLEKQTKKFIYTVKYPYNFPIHLE